MGTYYQPGQKLRGDPWLMLSSLGVGTYLGEPSVQDDIAQAAAIILSVHSGWNVIDTAANYREGRAEVGRRPGTRVCVTRPACHDPLGTLD